MDDNSVAAPVVKVVSVWAAVGITSWSEAAAAIAFFYTLLLIVEWFWKKLKGVKPPCPPSTLD